MVRYGNVSAQVTRLDQRTFPHEQARDSDRLLERAARVMTKVEQNASSTRRFEIHQDGLEVCGRAASFAGTSARPGVKRGQLESAEMQGLAGC
jgi:hypothetical protein